jgi:hypothetical protein
MMESIDMEIFAAAVEKLEDRVVPNLPEQMQDMTFAFLEEPSSMLAAHFLVAGIFAAALVCAYLTMENFLWKNPAHKLTSMGVMMLLITDAALGYAVYQMVA